MSIRKPAIPAITVSDMQINAILSALKENVEIMTGVRGATPLIPLVSSASNASIINAINAIMVRINSKGS